MPTPEWIQIVAVTALAFAAYMRQLEAHRQLRVTLLALLAIVATWGAKLSGRWIGPHAESILWDWLPGALMLIPYWQVGQFFTAPDPAVEARLSHWDSIIFQQLGVKPAKTRITTSISTYLELAYLLVYPLVPLGLIALYATGLRSQVSFYWIVVLSATYICFGFTLAIPARPPRTLSEYKGFQMPPTRVRALNREILNHASIQAITCPSAHVASALAAALVIVHLHTWLGTFFLWAAFSIAAATIVGGYHYVADVLLAALIALLVFAIASFM
ncbi:MAG: phosphatase PAP2 family protein [Acidobacteria bacterium]|nr:phosphatase PAP2 family protein [Acidobacteriota bacterium]MBV9480911.1 phosphatase PAP2 family protein [Acidobacteriota bacterium]